jgi:hypothetical protein
MRRSWACLSELYRDRSEVGRRAYAERLRGLGIPEQAIEILPNAPPDQAVAVTLGLPDDRFPDQDAAEASVGMVFRMQ